MKLHDLYTTIYPSHNPHNSEALCITFALQKFTMTLSTTKKFVMLTKPDTLLDAVNSDEHSFIVSATELKPAAAVLVVLPVLGSGQNSSLKQRGGWHECH